MLSAKISTSTIYKSLLYPLALLVALAMAKPALAGPYKIVSLAPNTTEILFALGLGDFIVGVDDYSNFPPEVRQIEKVGTFLQPNIEKIILLQPDYILVNTTIAADLKEYLEGLGATVIRISPGSIDGLFQDITMLGDLFNRREKAIFMIDDMKKRLKKISEDIRDKRPRVFVQISHDPLITISSFLGDAIEAAGGKNIAWDVRDDAALFSYEVLIERDPDIIIIAGFSGDTDFPDSINAVENNRIYSDFNPDIFLRPGPRIIEAIEELNKIFFVRE